ncbi:MAG TPA: GntR family transcriptional regulator [Vicinamibacterales bacterium]|nr:GntR family transcriptional regulator [Vicinamibacterales bacterium]
MASTGRSSGSYNCLRGVTGQVYSRLCALISSGALAPGAPLIETDLSLRLKVSRTPVRAALLKLQQEGLVHVTRVGQLARAVVAPLTADDVQELHYVVGALEGLAARRAAELTSRQRASVAEAMEHINARLTAATAARDLRTAQDLHVRFHRCYVEAVAGPRLLAELDGLQPQIERYERFYTHALINEHRFAEALREHEAIIAAIRQGSPDAAERAVAANWRNGARRYAPIVMRAGERGSWAGDGDARGNKEGSTWAVVR